MSVCQRAAVRPSMAPQRQRAHGGQASTYRCAAVFRKTRVLTSLSAICEERFHFFHHFHPRGFGRDQGMVLAIERHKSGIRY